MRTRTYIRVCVAVFSYFFPCLCGFHVHLCAHTLTNKFFFYLLSTVTHQQTRHTHIHMELKIYGMFRNFAKSSYLCVPLYRYFNQCSKGRHILHAIINRTKKKYSLGESFHGCDIFFFHLHPQVHLCLSWYVFSRTVAPVGFCLATS